MTELIAYHESGHAVMAARLGAVIGTVTLVPEWDDGPRRFADLQIKWPLSEMSEKEIREKSIWVALAGPVAEMIYEGTSHHPAVMPEWAADWSLAWEAAESVCPDDRQRMRFLEETMVGIDQLFETDRYWSAVAALADELVAHESLEGDQVLEVLDYWLRKS